MWLPGESWNLGGFERALDEMSMRLFGTNGTPSNFMPIIEPSEATPAAWRCWPSCSATVALYAYFRPAGGTQTRVSALKKHSLPTKWRPPARLAGMGNFGTQSSKPDGTFPDWNSDRGRMRLDHPRRDRGGHGIGRAAKAAWGPARQSGHHDRLNEPFSRQLMVGKPIPYSR